MKRQKKIMALAVLAAATCVAAEAQRKVTVCMAETAPVSVVELAQAHAKASEMFAAIGVKLDWRCPKSQAQGTIVISLARGVPANRKPGELAYAYPYEGTHIVIFYDCVRTIMPNQVPILLAHVLVHEVTHILQGIPRHSESGVMKAQWDSSDFSQMTWKPLPFTNEDIDLIQRGLDAREARSLLASNHVQ
jgi:hypothetical protein